MGRITLKDFPYNEKALIKLQKYENEGVEPEDALSALDLAKVAIALNKLKEYEKMFESGEAIKLPFKPGDSLFWVNEEKGYVEEQVGGVRAVVFYGNDKFKVISKDEDTPDDVGVPWNCLTKEEAENYLNNKLESGEWG